MSAILYSKALLIYLKILDLTKNVKRWKIFMQRILIFSALTNVNDNDS